MLTIHLRFTAALVAILFSLGGLSAQEPAGNAKVKELLKARAALAQELFKREFKRVQNATGLPEELLSAARLAQKSRLDLCETDQERVNVLSKHLAEMRDIEKLVEAYAKIGQGREAAALRAKVERLNTEIALEKAKGRLAGKQGTGKTNADLQDQAALAEKNVDIQKADLQIVEAQLKRAMAKLVAAKAQVVEMRATEAHVEKQLMRFRDLAKSSAIQQNIVEEQQLKFDAARAKRVAAEAEVAEQEAQVMVERARIQKAQFQVEEAMLRLQQIKARLTR